MTIVGLVPCSLRIAITYNAQNPTEKTKYPLNLFCTIKINMYLCIVFKLVFRFFLPSRAVTVGFFVL